MIYAQTELLDNIELFKKKISNSIDLDADVENDGFEINFMDRNKIKNIQKLKETTTNVIKLDEMNKNLKIKLDDTIYIKYIY